MEAVHHRDVVAHTKLGDILGDVRRVPGAGQILTFRKIPFAIPPVDKLRFRKPVPYGSWNGVLNGQTFGPSCMQDSSSLSPSLPNKDMSENCLHLNIYVPHQLSSNSDKSVMVWVHGGGYTMGQSFAYNGTELALRGDVIVVTINYRLGPFGFLRTDSKVSPGNYGLWDQNMAFQWVHDNIEAFGGNPNSVTIFGESAGGGSVSFQSLYPGNQGLFQRVIAQSGVATSWILRVDNTTAEAAALNMSTALGCNSSNTTEIVECLRVLSAKSFISVAIPGASMPVVDDDFVLDYPETVLRNTTSSVYKFYTSLDYMVGSMNGDGNVMVRWLIPENVLKTYKATYDTGLPTNLLCNYVADMIVMKYLSGKIEITSKICNLYRDNTGLVNQSNKIVDLFSDAMFTFPAILSADLHRGPKSTYAYYMTYVSPLQRDPRMLQMLTFPWTERATHAEDLFYLFLNDAVFYSTNLTYDVKLGAEMELYWTNFAKTG